MPKFALEFEAGGAPASFVERRKMRRIRMTVALTHNLISSDMTVSYREARCLIDCARKALLELYPQFGDGFERIVRPHFERVLASRWPGEQPLDDFECDVIN